MLNQTNLDIQDKPTNWTRYHIETKNGKAMAWFIGDTFVTDSYHVVDFNKILAYRKIGTAKELFS